jgi:hypothetical protein
MGRESNLLPHFSWQYIRCPGATQEHNLTDAIKRYNPRKRTCAEKMMAMRLWLIGLGWVLGSAMLVPRAVAAGTTSEWVKPAAALAEQIASILGPGQAQLTVRNLSTVQAAEIAAIRTLLEQDLKRQGVLASGAESANSIRVTLSESSRERLWVAEVFEGNQTRIAMVHLDLAAGSALAAEAHVVLRKERWRGVAPSNEPILFAAESNGTILLFHPENISELTATGSEWNERARFSVRRMQRQTRDPEGILSLNTTGEGFKAFAPATQCTGVHLNSSDGSGLPGEWTMRCQDSDDPWPILGAGDTNATINLKAFFNGARNYFTGVITPSVGVDLPPFYSAALLGRPAGGVALMINGIDGKVHLAENNVLRSVTGTRDWGSDFAVLLSGCDAGTQIIASSSGEAMSDSLRAYEIPALEAVPASAPLAMEGTVTAMWSAPDGKSVVAVVRSAGNQYEVDRVTALCN